MKKGANKHEYNGTSQNRWYCRERERESRNLKNKGFIGNVKKLYIKYRNIKINLVARS